MRFPSVAPSAAGEATRPISSGSVARSNASWRSTADGGNGGAAAASSHDLSQQQARQQRGVDRLFTARRTGIGRRDGGSVVARGEDEGDAAGHQRVGHRIGTVAAQIYV